jgi:hypothetical protein
VKRRFFEPARAFANSFCLFIRQLRLSSHDGDFAVHQAVEVIDAPVDLAVGGINLSRE